MQRGRQPGGYTIIEVMIFLAISGLMFVLAVYFVQGKQATAQFTQAMNGINTSVQQVINDVADNNYNPANLTCTITAITSPLSFTTSASNNAQGTNLGCVFLGETIQFGVRGTNRQGYDVYSIAACQYSGCTAADTSAVTAPTGFADSDATPVDPGDTDTCSAPSGAPGVTPVVLTTCNQLPWGMQATAMYDFNNGSPKPTDGIGFFNSFASQNGAGLNSGSQTVNVVDTGSTAIDDVTDANNPDEETTVGYLHSFLQDSGGAVTIISNPYFAVCFNDGAGHIGALIIGGGQQSGASDEHLSSTVEISSSKIYPFGASSYPNQACS